MRNNDYINDVPKYKKPSTARTPKKANHKHFSEPCVIEYPKNWYINGYPKSKETEAEISGYCPICGKMMSIKDLDRWYVDKPLQGFSHIVKIKKTEECLKELNPETRTLPTFVVKTPFEKFVKLQGE